MTNQSDFKTAVFTVDISLSSKTSKEGKPTPATPPADGKGDP
jgi:hypothetical protein